MFFSGVESQLIIGDTIRLFHLEDGRTLQSTIDNGTVVFHEASEQDIYSLLSGQQGVVVQVADVRTGYRNKEFGKDELLDAETCAQAVAMLEGVA